MRTCLIIVLLFIAASLLANPLQAWQELQRDISQQAAAYQNSPAHLQHKQNSDTRNYSVGDTKTFWRWNLSIMPPSWIQTPATCRAVGAHCYVFVADSEWNVHMNQANVDSVMARLEQNTPNNPTMGAIQMDIDLFGPIPDELDNDPKLIVFYSALGSFQGTSFDGYFSAYNQVTEAEAQQMNPSGHSNECEMIYMTCYPLSPVAPIRLSVLAHELEHLIHWGQDANEETWVDEGCAELAMVAYGVPDPISGFNSNPDNNLTIWNQTTADYVKVMLFFTYLQEHYDATGMIGSLVADPANGMASLNAQVAAHYPDTTTGEILRNWNIANIVDEPGVAGGLYNYQQLTLPNFSTTSMNQNPTMANLTVSGYAADYFSYANPQMAVTFDVQSPAQVYVSAVLFNTLGDCIEVLTGNQVQNIQFSPFASQAAKVVFVVSNPNSSPVTYSYTSSPVANDDSFLPSPTEPVISVFPNPFVASRDMLNITITGAYKYLSDSSLDIYNLKGQLVNRISHIEDSKSEALSTLWDGKDIHGNTVSSGIYLLRYSYPGGQLNAKVLVNK